MDSKDLTVDQEPNDTVTSLNPMESTDSEISKESDHSLQAMVQRIQLALQQLKRNIERSSANSVSEVTRPQMFVLHMINQFEKCNLTQLAEKMEVKPSAITVMIDRLEKAGYVERIQDETDRRVILVELTSLGERILDKAIQERSHAIKKYLSRLNEDEVILFTKCLEKMLYPDYK